MTGITGTLYEDFCTFVIIHRSVLLTMRNVTDTIVAENQITHFVFNKFLSELHVVNGIVQKYCTYKRDMRWRLKRRSTLYAAARHCLVSATMFLGNHWLNQKR
jgi:hypothetical protein